MAYRFCQLKAWTRYSAYSLHLHYAVNSFSRLCSGFTVNRLCFKIFTVNWPPNWCSGVRSRGRRGPTTILMLWLAAPIPPVKRAAAAGIRRDEERASYHLATAGGSQEWGSGRGIRRRGDAAAAGRRDGGGMMGRLARGCGGGGEQEFARPG
jgi:hypothetical protein